jgi:rhodanese-related sulfurtransferase
LASGGVLVRRIRALWADNPTGFVWVENGKIAASGYPASRGQLAWLCKKGVRSVLTLTESPLPSEWLEGLPLEVKHVAMRDHLPPEQSSLDESADFIAAQVDLGKPILVHCQAGRGRTMCALAAYLMKTKGMGAAEAIQALRRVRRGAVEEGQETALFTFQERLKNGDG